MIGLHNISQLYQKCFEKPGKTPITDITADLEDDTKPDVSAMEIEYKEGPSLREPLHDPELRTNIVDPIASLKEVVALASMDQASPPTSSSTSPSGRLQAVIRANRYPPGQKARFAAIDALRPELKHEDAVIGLKMSLHLLHGTLERALDDPTVIQQHQHVRNKLMTEYLGLPQGERIHGLSTDALIEGIKNRVGSRWRVEAMEKQ
jgi:hypothetical protein